MIFQVACWLAAPPLVATYEHFPENAALLHILHVYDTIWNLREQRKRVYEEDH